MNYLGIDVHKHESQVAVLDDDGEIDREKYNRYRNELIERGVLTDTSNARRQVIAVPR